MHHVLRVAIYIRVSTKMQEDRYSLSAQTLELTRYAQSQGWEIVDLFKDVDSGTKINKVGLEALLDSVEDGKVDVVLVIEQDRLSRLDTIAWEYLKNILRENKVKIAEPGYLTDLSNADDEFMSDFKNLLAQRSRRDLLRKMMRGKRQYTREGKVWGKQPDGYHYNRETKTVSIDTGRSWIIPYIDELYLEQGLGISQIAKKLNLVCKTPTGKEWTNAQVRDRLLNKAYHGVLEKHFENGETITVPDVYPPLRTLETYELITQKRKKNYSRKPAEAHFLRDISIQCAACGKVVSVNKSLSPGRTTGQSYEVFSLKHVNDITHANCPAKPVINTKRIKQNLIEAVKAILTDAKSASQYLDVDFDSNDLEKINVLLKELNKQKNETNTKIDRLLALYLNGKWSTEQLDKERALLDQQLARIEKSISEQKRKYELIQASQFSYNTVVEFLTIASRFDALLDKRQQQQLIGSLFPMGTLDAENNQLMLHAHLPQGITMDIRLEIETMESVTEREVRLAAKAKYEEIQGYLNKNHNTSLETLQKVFKCNHSTLIKYQQWFGAFNYLLPNRLRPELKEERVQAIKTALRDFPSATGRQLEELTGINRKAVYRLIQEEKLR